MLHLVRKAPRAVSQAVELKDSFDMVSVPTDEDSQFNHNHLKVSKAEHGEGRLLYSLLSRSDVQSKVVSFELSGLVCVCPERDVRMPSSRVMRSRGFVDSRMK